MNTIKVMTVLTSIILVSACTGPTYAVITSKADVASWDWVGCHEVVNNPGSDGSQAFRPIDQLLLKNGDKFYFKQIKDDGSVGPVTAGVPCKD